MNIVVFYLCFNRDNVDSGRHIASYTRFISANNTFVSNSSVMLLVLIMEAM